MRGAHPVSLSRLQLEVSASQHSAVSATSSSRLGLLTTRVTMKRGCLTTAGRKQAARSAGTHRSLAARTSNRSSVRARAHLHNMHLLVPRKASRHVQDATIQSPGSVQPRGPCCKMAAAKLSHTKKPSCTKQVSATPTAHATRLTHAALPGRRRVMARRGTAAAPRARRRARQRRTQTCRLAAPRRRQGPCCWAAPRRRRARRAG